MGYDMEPMLELFIYETNQLVDQLEQTCIEVEDAGQYSEEAINEIFRGMHTIKGSSGMMMYDDLSKLSHSLEDLFDLMRSNKEIAVDVQKVTDLTLDALDFIKEEMASIEAGEGAKQDASDRITNIKDYLALIKGEPVLKGERQKEGLPEVANYYIASQDEVETVYTYEITIFFDDDCVMENVRAFTLMNNLKDMCLSLTSVPDNLLEGDEALIDIIRKNGFYLCAQSNEAKEAFDAYLTGYPYVKRHIIDMGLPPDIRLEEIEGDPLKDLLQILEKEPSPKPELALSQSPVSILSNEHVVQEEIEMENSDVDDVSPVNNSNGSNTKRQADSKSNMTMISVSVDKLDKLMDLVGELVVSEAMVTRNSRVMSVMDEALNKSIRQHRKIINDMQDVAMSVRMVPLSATFQKMKRIVRDVSKNLDKKINLLLIGEHTEADKNIIEKISDPLMHLIRNACDHGIELPQERKAAGKHEMGTVTLEAKSSGGDVVILVRDDGKGLDADRIYQKAIQRGMVQEEAPRPADEILFSYIFMPGFSTKEEVSTYSGRGVGMDVVTKNIEKIGGNISIASEKGKGSTITIKIPLTLTIIEGMRMRVGHTEFIMPITAIRESFKLRKEQYVVDPDENEIVLIRGVSYSLLRLYKQYGIRHEAMLPTEGIVIYIGDEDKRMCLLVDELIGEQQVVVKPLPKYMQRVPGISGCAILGDGGISLILDMDGLLKIM